jgi:hypothetical protein
MKQVNPWGHVTLGPQASEQMKPPSALRETHWPDAHASFESQSDPNGSLPASGVAVTGFRAEASPSVGPVVHEGAG